LRNTSGSGVAANLLPFNDKTSLSIKLKIKLSSTMASNSQPSDLPMTEQLLSVERQPQEQENTRLESLIVKAIELIRIIGTVIAFYFGFGSDPKYRVSAALYVFCMAGLTGLESLFFGKISARAKKWAQSPYQAQSAANNIASAVAMIILLSIGANDAAIATLMMNVTIFILLSGINHCVAAIVDKINGMEIAMIHFQRIILALPLSVVVGLILGYWKPFKSNI